MTKDRRDADAESFDELTFADFKRLAKDPSLSRYEKIGFPDSYRAGKEDQIFQDIVQKLSRLALTEQVVLEIGPGCGELPLRLIALCRTQRHRLILVDSEEMLAHLPNEPFIRKVPAFYPRCRELFEEYAAKVNVIVAYSVLHHLFREASIFEFLDKSLSLLAHGGQMLIGDVPNISKRKRFFASPEGIRYHQAFTKTTEVPAVQWNALEPGRIDDAVIVSILLRCRQAGFDAYLLPQRDDLPMANRREDILIRKP